MKPTNAQRAPVVVEAMIICRVLADPTEHERWNTPAFVEAVGWLHRHGLIAGQGVHSEATERGKAWLEMICATPLPEERTVWVDPRL